MAHHTAACDDLLPTYEMLLCDALYPLMKVGRQDLVTKSHWACDVGNILSLQPDTYNKRMLCLGNFVECEDLISVIEGIRSQEWQDACSWRFV